MKILIVDDELDIKSLFEQKFRNELKNNEVTFHFAYSGEDALKFLNTMESAELVLILSDINMPGMTGLELLKIIKNDYSHLKVFMITAYDDEEKQVKARTLGADKYLTKPIDFEELKREIGQL